MIVPLEQNVEAEKEAKEAKLTFGDRALLFSLKRKYYYFKKQGTLGADGSFWYQDRKMAEEDGISRRTIIRARRRLEKFGYIYFDLGKWKGKSTRYWITAKGAKMTPFKPSQRVPICPSKGANLSIKGCQNVTSNIYINKDTNHSFLPRSYWLEVFKANNNDEILAKEFLLSQGYTEQQIEEQKSGL